MMRRCLAFALAAACGHPATHDSTTPAHEADDPSCPMVVPGTAVAVEDTDRGAALVFVTTGDVDKVRERAKFLAAAHSKRNVTGAAAGHEMSDMIATKSTADETDVDHGGRVVFVATSESDIPSLQSELRMHASHLAAGSCRMAM